ncbi:hypothetical protein GCM10027405_01280 [Arthrobacter alkaliphilus]
MNTTTAPFDGTRSAKDVFTDFLNTIDDAVQNSGTTFPGWDRKRTAGYSTESCAIKSKEDGHRYAVVGEGGPVSDPKAAVESMKAHWQALGYTVEGAVPWPGPAGAIDLSATTPAGVRIVFGASTNGSTINVKSDCTRDPLARETTTETVPLGGTGGGGPMSTTGAPNLSTGTRPAKDVFTDFLNTIDDAVQHSGTTFPRWNRQHVAGYNAPACGVKAREDGNQYYTNIEGGPVSDPKAAVESMKAHWEALGYTIEGAVPWPGENQRIDLSATSPLGTRVVFSPSKGKSGINVKSDCTLDPLAKETTTDTIPLDGNRHP